MASKANGKWLDVTVVVGGVREDRSRSSDTIDCRKTRHASDNGKYNEMVTGIGGRQ